MQGFNCSIFCLVVFIFLGRGIAEPAHSQEVILPTVPDTLKQPLPQVNAMPLSQVDIPVVIALKPVYDWANKFIDTLYTSPDFPKGWLMQGCEVRYQYRFVRGPFRFMATNNILTALYTGTYGVRGSTRICSSIGNSVWTPACSCGFGTEKPRRIDAGFLTTFRLMPDYSLGVQVVLNKPVPVDKCSVCFFGKDITQTVADRLKIEMEASIADMQKKLQSFSLKPYLQTIWDTLQTPYAIPGFGYLNMQPEALRISQATLRNDSMFFSIGLSARPVLKAAAINSRKPLPNLTDFKQRGGFALYIGQLLPYDSLNALVNAQAAGKEFTVGKGLLKKTIHIDSVRMLGGGEKVFLKVYLSRGIRGAVFLEGKPVWDGNTQKLEIKEVDYELKTRQLLVKSATWLMDGTIQKKLQEYTRFDLAEKVTQLKLQLEAQMNRDIAPGIKSKGKVFSLKVEKLTGQPEGIYIAGSMQGFLGLTVNAGTLIMAYLR
jgi:hypothetical protein